MGPLFRFFGTLGLHAKVLLVNYLGSFLKILSPVLCCVCGVMCFCVVRCVGVGW